MKKNLLILALAVGLWTNTAQAQAKKSEAIKVQIDLNKIVNDQVNVTVYTPKMQADEAVFNIPKIIPGTYSVDDYGKFIENLTAYDASGKTLSVEKKDDNSWTIKNAKKLVKISYFVNDTYDTENTHKIFSPAGTNIEADKNILVNTHGFVGYFSGYNENPYQVKITHPENLWGATSMTDLDASATADVFETARYAELVENPIMYSKKDVSTFTIQGMDILIAVYSPNGTHSAESLTADMQRMMVAQKTFLGSFNANKKYSVLIYLSDMQKEKDARGFGALEHPTCTTVVMPEAVGKDELAEQLKDVVSHEFFHIVTPLTIHSNEIHYFDFNSPKMSQHLWMYEGVTEYFANLFQVNQGLIDEVEFYSRMAGKIANAARMDDQMSFTTMSANVLSDPYKEQYLNVYEKGALIGMCIDIIIREKSNGTRGILDLMQQLSAKFGAQKPFNDQELFATITALTYPEVGEFLTTYVAGETPIPYDTYFAKMGVTKKVIQVAGNPFIKDQRPLITVNPATKEIIVLPASPLNSFFTELGLQAGDIITAINDTNYNLDNIYDMIMASEGWKQDDAITVSIKRDEKNLVIQGKVKLPMEDQDGFEATNQERMKLKDAWLKG
ncbi:MAG: peptidase M61 [Flavobacterium sp.]|nr:peptidase M61 [Flavobacterium sp.]